MTNDIPKYIGDLLEMYEKGQREFPYCDFTEHENLQYLILDDSNLQGSTFLSADFTGTSFRNCNLKNCEFKCCKFVKVDFNDADLSGSQLTGSEFVVCNFFNSRLEGVKWFGHSLSTAEFLSRIIR